MSLSVTSDVPTFILCDISVVRRHFSARGPETVVVLVVPS